MRRKEHTTEGSCGGNGTCRAHLHVATGFIKHEDPTGLAGEPKQQRMIRVKSDFAIWRLAIPVGVVIAKIDADQQLSDCLVPISVILNSSKGENHANWFEAIGKMVSTNLLPPQ